MFEKRICSMFIFVVCLLLKNMMLSFLFVALVYITYTVHIYIYIVNSEGMFSSCDFRISVGPRGLRREWILSLCAWHKRSAAVSKWPLLELWLVA